MSQLLEELNGIDMKNLQVVRTYKEKIRVRLIRLRHKQGDNTVEKTGLMEWQSKLEEALKTIAQGAHSNIGSNLAVIISAAAAGQQQLALAQQAVVVETAFSHLYG